MIERREHLAGVRRLLSGHRVVAIVGARQVGKTTLARQVVKAYRGTSTVFDLEEPGDLARLSEPMLTLRDLSGLVVLDEIQRKPDLFPALRVLVDRPRPQVRFLVLGSASPDLLKQSSESLAGRIAYHNLGPFSLGEVEARHLDRLWLRGGFPRSFLARSHRESAEWRQQFIRTLMERDMPQLGISVPSATLRRFWSMLAHYHGQVWNSSEFARSFGVADTTVRRYLDILAATFLVRVLQPYHENISKRQVKAPKVYLADSGLLHSLLNVVNRPDIEGHPKVGASWEGFALNQVRSHLGAREDECFFWATHGGAELDLLVARGRRKWGFEFKRTDSPRVTPSMRSALADLRLDRLDVVHAGDHTFDLSKRIRAVALSRIQSDLKSLP
jgi:predicted AAA+ superfamily ATPase